MESEKSYIHESLETISSRYCDSWENNDNKQEDDQEGVSIITNEAIEVSIIDKEQHQETEVIDTKILVSRRKGPRSQKTVTFDHTMKIILTQMYVNEGLKLFEGNCFNRNIRKISRWYS